MAATSLRSVLLVNAIALAICLPGLLRISYEAVALRLLEGPQLLGFSLAHGGGGPFGAVLFFSYLFSLIFLGVAGLSAALFLLPAFRRRYTGWRSVVLMFAGVVAFQWLTDALQNELPRPVLLLGAPAIVLLVLLLLYCIARSIFPKGQIRGGA